MMDSLKRKDISSTLDVSNIRPPFGHVKDVDPNQTDVEARISEWEAVSGSVRSGIDLLRSKLEAQFEYDKINCPKMTESDFRRQRDIIEKTVEKGLLKYWTYSGSPNLDSSGPPDPEWRTQICYITLDDDGNVCAYFPPHSVGPDEADFEGKPIAEGHYIILKNPTLPE